MNLNRPILVKFYKTESGKEPVREWLKGLAKEERKIIGEDIKTVQFSWPVGMPVVKKIEPDIWEVRSILKTESPEFFLRYMKMNSLFYYMGLLKKIKSFPKKTDILQSKGF